MRPGQSLSDTGSARPTDDVTGNEREGRMEPRSVPAPDGGGGTDAGEDPAEPGLSSDRDPAFARAVGILLDEARASGDDAAPRSPDAATKNMPATATENAPSQDDAPRDPIAALLSDVDDAMANLEENQSSQERKRRDIRRRLERSPVGRDARNEEAAQATGAVPSPAEQ